MVVRNASPSPLPLALIVGGSRGLGLLLARDLGKRGHRVVIAARDAEELAGAAAQLRQDGISVSTEVCDVADVDAATRLVDGVEQRLGAVDVLMYVAGVIQVGPLDSMKQAHYREAIDVMLWGPIATCLAATRHMRRRRRGSIGVVTSIGGVVSVPHLLPYSTAKFGAVGFTRGLRAELAGSGVTVTTIIPGLMRTGSPLRAKFTGRQSAEYLWFSTAGNLPLLSMDAEIAAARMVDGVLAGRAHVVLTPVAKVAMRVNGVAPSTTTFLLGVAGRLLPRAPRRDNGTVEGWQVENRLPKAARAVVRGVTVLGQRAATRNNERTTAR